MAYGTNVCGTESRNSHGNKDDGAFDWQAWEVGSGIVDNRECEHARRQGISTSEWDTDDTILVALPEKHFTSAARVTYCDPMGDGRFGTCLEFVGKDEQLEITALAMASQSRKSQRNQAGL
jgi:hypothetical protein